MKITDFALIFIVIILPLIVVVYINVSFTIKSFQQELFYRKLVDTAIQDSMQAMKEVESKDPELDYGYSGIIDNRININANIGKSAFLESIYNNLDIRWVQSAEEFVQQFIPVIAIIDYNGVYISSIDTYSKQISSYSSRTRTEHVLKPKRYYAYTYGIDNSGNIVDTPEQLAIEHNFRSIHHIEFTLDDRIVHHGKRMEFGSWADYDIASFYITDQRNNSVLYDGGNEAAVINHLQKTRKNIIVSIITNEMIYAANKNNIHARENGISYNFVFPDVQVEDMYRYIENTGVLALVQGIKVGNKYLNYCAYGGGDLALRRRYYLSLYFPGVSKVNSNLYHKGPECPEYKISIIDNLIPGVTDMKTEAAGATITRNGVQHTGFYPCPVCRP